MTAFATIVADTFWNDAEILDAIVGDLDERWRAAGSPPDNPVAAPYGPKSVWLSLPLDAAKTLSGEYDEETDTTTLYSTGAGSDPWGFTNQILVGRRFEISGVGAFAVLSTGIGENPSVVVQGDATCAGATWRVAPAGNVLDAAFWSQLQRTAQTIIPLYLDTYTYPAGFAGLAVLPFFSVVGAAFLTVALGDGYRGWPRRIRARGPCSLTYDAEADTTTIVDLATAENHEPDFVAGHVGMRVDVFGVGQFKIATVESADTITIEGDAARSHPDTVVSILPDDPVDLSDAAFDKYGLCERGDVLGPWLLFDLIAACKALKKTAATSAYGVGGAGNFGEGYATVFPNNTFADAKSAAEAAFAGGYGGGLYAFAITEVWGGGAHAVIERGDVDGVGWNVPEGSDPLVYDVDVYAIPTAQGTFDGNGDFAAPDVLTLVGSGEACPDRSGTSEAAFGNHAALPAWSAADPGSRGYQVWSVVGAVTWNFTHSE